MKTTRKYNLGYRNIALKKLLENCPKWNTLILYMDNFISLVLSKLKLLSATDLEQKYRLALIASYIRTHYVILDLIESSDLIEAATLIRKQVELLARFNEIESVDLKKLSGKVPQVKYVNVGRTYGSLSEIAHSSKPETLSLLGIQESGCMVSVSIYPEFNEHSLTTISIYCDIFCKFASAILQFKQISDSGDFSLIAMDILNKFIETGIDSNIQYFEDWKEE